MYVCVGQISLSRDMRQTLLLHVRDAHLLHHVGDAAVQSADNRNVYIHSRAQTLSCRLNLSSCSCGTTFSCA